MTRALVLGSGGVTGVAWLAGVLQGVADEGVDLTADRLIGTSGGALVAARLAGGAEPSELIDLVRRIPRLGRIDAPVITRLLAAQLWPSRPAALRWLGRVAPNAAALGPEEFVAAVGDWACDDWPPSLTVVVTAVATGIGVALDATNRTSLVSALAASCAVPGVFPPVRLGDDWYFDGGLRSPANADLAADCARVLVLTPLSRSLRRSRRPAAQAARLDRALLLTPPTATFDILDPSRTDALIVLGREQGRRAAPRVAELWQP